MHRWIILLGLLCFPVLMGCSSSPYLEDYRYTPRPATARVHPANMPNAEVLTAMGSVIGVRREDSEQRIPESVEVRLRLDNTGSAPVSFDPRSMQLMTGQLVNFRVPMVRAPSPIVLEPLQSTTVTALFPIPENAGEMESLILKWVVEIKGQPVTQTLNFQRVYASSYYYDPYWAPYTYAGYPPQFWYGGVVVVRH
jgi:hypothetical protein